MTCFMRKVTLGMCVLLMAGLGGWTGGKISTKRYPISMIERINLTPEVKPGDPIEFAQHVDRHDQCDIEVKRVISTASGQRISIKQNFEEGFGPLGGDRYVLPVPTPLMASLGPARMYSKAYSWCNWLDYLFWPSEAEPHVIDFLFADATRQLPAPDGFKQMLVKPTSTVK